MQNERFLELVQTATAQQVQKAIDEGADPDARNEQGRTPLMYAVAVNHDPEMIIALLKAGADATAKDGDGKTAFDYARRNNEMKGTDAYEKLRDAVR